MCFILHSYELPFSISQSQIKICHTKSFGVNIKMAVFKLALILFAAALRIEYSSSQPQVAHMQPPPPPICPYTGQYGPCTPNPITKELDYDTIFNAADGRTLAFKDLEYWELSSSGIGSSGLISQLYPGLPGNIDAAYSVTWATYTVPHTYFYKENQYWRYYGERLEEGYPKYIKTKIPGIPTKLDAAFSSTDVYGKEHVYYFKGQYYWRVCVHQQPGMTQKRLIANEFNGLPGNVDAAFRHTDGLIYFVKGDQYYQLNEKNMMVAPVSSPFSAARPPVFPTPLPDYSRDIDSRQGS